MNPIKHEEVLDELSKKVQSTPLMLAIGESLAKLGDTPNEVAENLYAMGYQGCTKKMDNCPIARFILDRFPVMDVSVSANGITVGLLDEVYLISPPLPVSIFILRFDFSGYPNLINP